MTAEQAEQRLARLKEELWGKEKQRPRESREEELRQHFAKAATEIEMAVDKGRMTAEQAEQRLARLKEELWGKQKRKPDASSRDAEPRGNRPRNSRPPSRPENLHRKRDGKK